MPNVVLLKNNKVVSIIFSVDADAAVLSDTAQVGDVFDPVTGLFGIDPAIAQAEQIAAEEANAALIASEAEKQAVLDAANPKE